MVYVLAVLDTILGGALLVLIFLHSGKGTGLSTGLGGGMGALGGAGVVQKNLDRLTIVSAVLFFAVTVALGFLM